MPKTGNVQLGDRVKDTITGFSGIVIGVTDYLYGCKHVLVAPEGLTKEGKRLESDWLDEDRLVVEKRGVVARPESAAVRAGGPATEPLPARR